MQSTFVSSLQTVRRLHSNYSSDQPPDGTILHNSQEDNINHRILLGLQLGVYELDPQH